MKGISIRVIVSNGEAKDEKIFKVGIVTPLGSCVREETIKTTDKTVDGMIDICDQLNEKDLGFTIEVKKGDTAS